MRATEKDFFKGSLARETTDLQQFVALKMSGAMCDFSLVGEVHYECSLRALEFLFCVLSASGGDTSKVFGM